MTTATRTDVHSPTNLDPEAYTYRGVFDLYPEADGDPFYAAAASRDRADAVARLLAEGLTFASVHPYGQCDHCGSRLRYAAYLEHGETRKVITVGETCLDNRFSLTKAEFDRLRKTASLNRERVALRTLREEFLAAHPGLAEALETDHHISADLASKFRRYGSLSDRQVALAFRLQEQEREREERRAAREAEEAAAAAAGVRVPEGRVEVVGEVVSVKWQESAYGTTQKMLVKVAEGWKVWGTVPARLDAERGAQVRFTATVTPSEDDALFGFYKRPSKAERVA